MSAEIAIEEHQETRYWNLNLLEVAFEFVQNPTVSRGPTKKGKQALHVYSIANFVASLLK